MKSNPHAAPRPLPGFHLTTLVTGCPFFCLSMAPLPGASPTLPVAAQNITSGVVQDTFPPVLTKQIYAHPCQCPLFLDI